MLRFSAAIETLDETIPQFGTLEESVCLGCFQAELLRLFHFSQNLGEEARKV